jgi:hypothetical protein
VRSSKDMPMRIKRWLLLASLGFALLLVPAFGGWRGASE